MMWAGCIVFSAGVIPFGLLLRLVPVPTECCIPALASKRPPPPTDADAGDVEMGLLQGPASDEAVNQNARKLKPGSKWASVQDVHTTVSVVQSFRRSGRK